MDGPSTIDASGGFIIHQREDILPIATPPPPFGYHNPHPYKARYTIHHQKPPPIPSSISPPPSSSNHLYKHRKSVTNPNPFCSYTNPVRISPISLPPILYLGPASVGTGGLGTNTEGFWFLCVYCMGKSGRYYIVLLFDCGGSCL